MLIIMNRNIIKGKYNLFYNVVSAYNISTFTTENILNPKNKERCIKKFTSIKLPRHFPPFPLFPITKTREAATLIPLCHDKNNELALLYTIRAADLRTHGGQLSFPGGMKDKEDRTFIDTALRETNEELGIEKDQIEIWCMGNPVGTPARIAVTPVIGYIANPDIFNIIRKNPAEVEEVCTVPLSVLCKPENCKYTQYILGYSPVFLGGPKRIWGSTAIQTHLLLLSIMPESYYNNEIDYTQPTKRFF